MRKVLSLLIALLAVSGCETRQVTREDFKDFFYGFGKIAYDSAKAARETNLR